MTRIIFNSMFVVYFIFAIILIIKDHESLQEKKLISQNLPVLEKKISTEALDQDNLSSSKDKINDENIRSAANSDPNLVNSKKDLEAGVAQIYGIDLKRFENSKSNNLNDLSVIAKALSAPLPVEMKKNLWDTFVEGLVQNLPVAALFFILGNFALSKSKKRNILKLCEKKYDFGFVKYSKKWNEKKNFWQIDKEINLGVYSFKTTIEVKEVA